MSMKSDRWIRRMVEEHQMIDPFLPELVREVNGDGPARRIISAGASSYGYDIRLAPDEFKIFTDAHGIEIDPKNFDERLLVQLDLRRADDGSEYFLMPPHSFALGLSVETFNLPRTVTALCIGKSTYIRSAVALHITPLEASWRGRLVLEIKNEANSYVRVYVNEGIAQLLFFDATLETETDHCLTSYADRSGKYQDQASLTLSKV